MLICTSRIFNDSCHKSGQRNWTTAIGSELYYGMYCGAALPVALQAWLEFGTRCGGVSSWALTMPERELELQAVIGFKGSVVDGRGGPRLEGGVCA